jgi:CubicO group peptidase (beta-lactamase class C family)
VDDAFREPGPDTKRNTQAIVVVLGDQIIVEKYKTGFDENTPLLGWSMSKSVTNAFVGILVKEGLLDIMKPAPVAAWEKEGDPRGKITLDMLLRMSSGLEFEESYAPFKDATYMLYASRSMAEYAQAKPLQAALDKKWVYSSGTTNIIARIVRDKTGGTLASMKKYFNERLFDKLGMVSAIIEADASGSLVGSSYMFATARDWARFGLFIKNDGIWKNERILPKGWVKYSSTPTPKAPMGKYGAHFWLNAGERENPLNRTYPSLPRDLVYLSGFNNQVVAIIPSKDIVVVRIGVTHDDSWSNETFIKDVLGVIDK